MLVLEPIRLLYHACVTTQPGRSWPFGILHRTSTQRWSEVRSQSPARPVEELDLEKQLASPIGMENTWVNQHVLRELTKKGDVDFFKFILLASHPYTSVPSYAKLSGRWFPNFILIKPSHGTRLWTLNPSVVQSFLSHWPVPRTGIRGNVAIPSEKKPGY